MADNRDDGGALPPGWKAVLDKESGDTYYYHVETNETTVSR